MEKLGGAEVSPKASGDRTGSLGAQLALQSRFPIGGLVV